MKWLGVQHAESPEFGGRPSQPDLDNTSVGKQVYHHISN